MGMVCKEREMVSGRVRFGDGINHAMAF